MSGIGFGLGTDRTLLACEAEGIELGGAPRVEVFCIAIGDDARHISARLLAEFRARGVNVDMAYGSRALKGAMKAADRSGAPIVLIIGHHEVDESAVQVKDMATGDQSAVSLTEVVSEVHARLGRLA
jgi:histidyl-tRNA synthetase